MNRGNLVGPPERGNSRIRRLYATARETPRVSQEEAAAPTAGA